MANRSPARRRRLFLEALEERTTPTVVASFTWAMEDRFGLDKGSFNNPTAGPDGRIDIWNDPTFVQAKNGFNVLFDGSGTTATGSPISYRWTITDSTTGALVRTLVGQKPSTLLPEGNYQVALRARTGNTLRTTGEFIGEEDTFVSTVRVNDILILSMGDSYASGEGNPDKPLFSGGDEAIVFWADSPDAAFAHRSGKSAHAYAALQLEQSSPHTSVTFVSVASGGAQLQDGMTTPKKRWNTELAGHEEWEIAGVDYTNDLVKGVVDTVDVFSVFEHQEPAAESQIAAAKRIVGSRAIDALLLSIGGNDAKFVPTATDLFLNSGDPATNGIQATFDAAVATLPALYKTFNQAILDNLNVNSRDVFITEYPDPARNENGGFEAGLKDVLPSLPGFVEFQIDATEFQWASNYALAKLNGAVQAAADAHNWTFVPGAKDLFRTHGITSTDPWINTASVARGNQGPFTVGADASTRLLALGGEVAALTAALTPLVPAGVLFLPVLASLFVEFGAAAVLTPGILAEPLDRISTNGHVHPNDDGYFAWSDVIRVEVAKALAKDAAKEAASINTQGVADLRVELVVAPVAGQPVQIRVRAMTEANTTAAQYRGTVRLTSTIDGKSGSEIVEVGAYTFTEADAGTKIFSVPFRIADSLLYSTQDVNNAAFAGSLRVDVPSDTLVFVGLPGAVRSGDVINFFVQARTANGAVDVGYRGTVTIPSGFGYSISPTTYTFTAADAGTKTFQIQLAGLTVPLTAPVTVTDGGPLPRFRQQVVTVVPGPYIAAGTPQGMDPEAKLFSTVAGEPVLTVRPFPAEFRGGVRVTVGDFTGDGVPDLATAAGPGGGPHVRIFDGGTGEQIQTPLGSFFAFDPNFSGGVQIAAGDVDGDGVIDLVVAAGAGGGPHVRVFSGLDGSELRSFFAFDPTFRGGVTLAVGDSDGDGLADITVGAGVGGAPHVRTFSGLDGSELRSFFAFDPSFRGGVSVAQGDLDGDGILDLVAGAGPGGGPMVRTFDGKTGAAGPQVEAYASDFRGGVLVTAVDVDRDGRAEVVTGAGAGGGPHVRTFDGRTLALVNEMFAFDPGFLGGVNVGGRAKTT